MPKNKGKGGKNRRRGKNENDNEKRELTFKEDGQEYAQVVKMLGYVLKSLFSYSASDASHPSTQDGSLFFCRRRRYRIQRLIARPNQSVCSNLLTRPLFFSRNGRLEAQCFDGTRRLGNIRGKLRKKVWINQGDIILLSLRDYQDDKGDVM